MKNKSKKKSNLFVKKLNEILMQEKNQHAISWTVSGEAFTINDIQNFSENILPKHYKHKNFSSFVRCLNMYSFHKVKEDVFEYFHPYFKKGQPGLLTKIQRKNCESVSQKKITRSLSERIEKAHNRQCEIEEGLRTLQEQYHVMISHNKDLLTELSESRIRTNSALSVLNTYLNKKNSVIQEPESPSSESFGEIDEWPSL